MYSDLPAPNRRCNTPASSPWSCGTVSAGVHFFPPPRFHRQEPRRQQGQGLVVMPPPPGADLVVRQARLPLAPLQPLLDPVLPLEPPPLLPHPRVPLPVPIP